MSAFELVADLSNRSFSPVVGLDPLEGMGGKVIDETVAPTPCDIVTPEFKKPELAVLKDPSSLSLPLPKGVGLVGVSAPDAKVLKSPPIRPEISSCIRGESKGLRKVSGIPDPIVEESLLVDLD